VRNGDRFTKAAFTLDFEQGLIRCPNAVTIPFQPGQVVRFPEDQCTVCPLRAQCTTSQHGRSVSIHADEALLVELRHRQQTKAGRATLRERVTIEHALEACARTYLTPAAGLSWRTSTCSSPSWRLSRVLPDYWTGSLVGGGEGREWRVCTTRGS
jgi:hypothetical protein